MAVLNAWQKLDRVISGKPFGDGADGAYSSATIPTLTKDSCSGTATSTTLTTTGSTFANGDILLIHQTRGTGVGQWEINKVASGGGSTSLTLSVALNYTYTDSGASQSQATKIPMYSTATVQSGTWTVPTWNQNTAGLLVIATSTLTNTGNTVANSAGHRGGANSPDAGNSGEGTVQDTVQGGGKSGSAGGIGDASTYGHGGGGGGNGAAGSGNSGGVDNGGAAVGSADLITMDFGGGAASGVSGNPRGAGGAGGGLVIIFAKTFVVTGSISSSGGNGEGGVSGGGGGGGAGGSILIVCQTATLGNNLITATAGSGGSGAEGNGGNGGTGRIAVHHSGTVTGTTNPTFTDTTDTSLVEATSSGFFALL